VAIIAALVDADTSSVGERDTEKCAEAIDCKIRSSETVVRVGCSMRIAQITPFDGNIAPQMYGGRERVVAWLVGERVQRSLGNVGSDTIP
jgi:hypothetical protein